jgi:hypothetical protein
MPFDPEFDDVYASIKGAVEGALAGQQGKCFRLDEQRPAGRITDRLVRELDSATFCVADLTNERPNVVWETGYAMALGKPTIILVQGMGQLPFDLKDMQTIRYDRRHLKQSLVMPLQGAVLDTIRVSPKKDGEPRADPNELIGVLLSEVQELKSIVANSVNFLVTPPATSPPSGRHSHEAAVLEGAWVSEVPGSHLYARVIDGELIVPYCYAGNDRLSAAYSRWKRVGDYWFARFAWRESKISGFTFLRQESIDVLTGAYWHDYQVPHLPTAPPNADGTLSRFRRDRNATPPPWAESFFASVRNHGLPNWARR